MTLAKTLSGFPKLFGGAVLAKSFVLLWLGSHGFPRCTSDAILFKQPAYMYLANGTFSIPTTTGDWPHATEVFAGFPPFYTYANVVVFKALGFSGYTSLGLDLFVHLVLSVIIGVVLLRLTGSQLIASLFLFLCTFLMAPIGRPEELSVLLTVVGVILVGRRRYVLSGIVLGLGAATALLPGMMGIVVCVVYDATKRGWSKASVLRSLGILAASVVIALVTWASAISPHFAMGLEQFKYHASNRTWRPSLISLVAENPFWGLFLGSCALLTVLVGGFLISTDRERYRNHLLTAILISMPVCIAVEVALHRAFYDYRLVGYLCIAGAIYVSYVLFVSRTGVEPSLRKGYVGAVALSSIVSVTVFANGETLRYALLPFAWNGNSASYGDAVNTVNHLVPSQASVGGDGVLWTTITDGRPYYALHLLLKGRGELPQFVVSTTFWGDGGKPAVMLDKGWNAHIESSYQELTPLRAVGDRGCNIELPFLGLRIPIARYACDWTVRVWKLKDDAVQAMGEAH